MKAKRALQYVLASTMFTIVGFQQNLPNALVIASFGKKYPKSKYTTWKHKGGTIWEAAFLCGKKERTALFTENGEWLGTCTYLPLGIVPKTVMENYRKGDTSNALVKIFQVENPKGIFYEFRSDGDNDSNQWGYIHNGRSIKDHLV